MAMRLKNGILLSERYEIQKVAGDGSFGVVYAARDIQTDRLVAIKEMPMQCIVDCESQAHLRASLKHPAVPRVHDYFSTQDHAYLVTDLIHGEDLEKILETGTDFLDERLVLDWAIQLCEALDYLHTHPLHTVIFRDLKPNNVMLDRAGRLHLVDFGLARSFPPRFFEVPQPEYEHLRKGLAIGTEGYSPPEQYDGIVMPQSDLYALGASLHHLLTRRDPRNEPAFSFSQAPVRLLNPRVSLEFEAVIMKAVQLEPLQRHPSARAMLIRLRALTLTVPPVSR